MIFFSTLHEYWELTKLQRRIAKSFPSFKEQKYWIKQLQNIDRHIQSAHNSSHILQFLAAIFELPPGEEGCIVEAGAYKGAGTAKISLAANYKGKKLYVFDSFQGLPHNNERHDKTVSGTSIKNWFEEGKFFGSLDEVKDNVAKYGDISVCRFMAGWFEDTMPSFNQKIALAYIDVDLAKSTRTCLKYLYPLLVPGGAIFSQDGDFPLVIEVLKDKRFWIEEVGCAKIPGIRNLGKKITIILK